MNRSLKTLFTSGHILKLLIPVVFICFAAAAAAQEGAEAAQVDSGDTAWMLTSSVLVLMMSIPGLFLFYGGMVRSKNALGTMMHTFFIVALITIQWVVIGYTLSFGSDIASFVGGFDWFGLKGVGPEPNADLAGTIPHHAFMVFQMTFAIITVALITGAFAERAKFSTFIIFVLLWSTLIYDPICHWVWGGGWVGGMGALDFAGGTVVHINSGAAALAAAMLYGRRKGYGQQAMTPHILPFSLIGAAMLWVGWFGFNAGSALASNGLAATAFVTTQVATAAAVLSWTFTEWIVKGKPTILGAATGAVAGLVCITPAAGFVDPLSAIAIGVGGGIFCFFALSLKAKFGFDDSLDVVAVHGVGGTWGALATGLFASVGGGTGLFFGNPGQLWIQFIAVAATWVYSFGGTLIILVVLKAIMGLRVSSEDEELGLDLSQHNEKGYSF
ncbi:MAG: ammonium transporter [Thermodesulfobacteriota bacterium]